MGCMRRGWLGGSGRINSILRDRVRRGVGFGRLLQAIFATAPEHDLGFVDVEAVIIGRLEAGSLADNTIDVDDLAAAATDEVMVVVTSSRLEPCG